MNSNLETFTTENLHYYTHIKDLKGRYVECNNRLINDIGIARNDFIGFTDLEMALLPKNEAKNFRRNDQAVISDDRNEFFMEPLTLSNKKFICFSQKSPYRGKNSKKIIGSFTFSLLVTQENFPVPQTSSNNNAHCKLSKRQFDCLLFLVKGMTLRQIATQLNLSYKTVEHYLEPVRNKLGCPSPSYQTNNQMFDSLLAINVRIILASAISYLSSEPLNSFLMATIKIKMQGRLIGVRFVFSTVIASAGDSALFTCLAFYGTMKTHDLILLAVTMWLIKVFIEFIGLPISIILSKKLKEKERMDMYDRGTKFNIFSLDTNYKKENNAYFYAK